MEIGFSVNDAVRKRYSVRTYDAQAVEQEMKEKLLIYGVALQNPLGPKVKLRFIEKNPAADGEKLGTYGDIKGAGLYLGALIADEETAPEALGYEFEQLVLYATSLGLGTCWLGGTFNRGAFAAAMDIGESELFPIISPVGYPAAQQRITERLFRRTLGADKRMPWDSLFFHNDFGKPLSREAAGRYEYPLEMLRMAPSAVNLQPWRVVLDGNAFHFFEKHARGGKVVGTVDMQRIDVGIAMCHFHLAAQETGLSGRFVRNQPDTLNIPENTTYVASWVME